MLVATIFTLAVIAADDAAVKAFVENCESRLPVVTESMKKNIKQPPAPKIPLSGQQLKAFYVEQRKPTEALKAKLKRLDAKDVSCLEICATEFGRGNLEVGSVQYAPKSSGIVLQVIDGDNVLLQWGTNGAIWLSGISTAGMTDGATVTWPEWLEVYGTQTYQTAIGSRTVFKLRPFDIDAARKLWHERHQKP